jgi:hypothetical protein
MFSPKATKKSTDYERIGSASRILIKSPQPLKELRMKNLERARGVGTVMLDESGNHFYSGSDRMLVSCNSPRKPRSLLKSDSSRTDKTR